MWDLSLHRLLFHAAIFCYLCCMSVLYVTIAPDKASIAAVYVYCVVSPPCVDNRHSVFLSDFSCPEKETPQ